MKSLFTAIMTKLSGSNLSTNVGGRIYEGMAPERPTYPHVVFSKVSGTNEDTFTERVDGITIQFSLYSTSRGITEIGTMYDNLRTLMDGAVFSITGKTLVRCIYRGDAEINTDLTTPEGVVGLRHWPVDYLMTVRAN